jgi:penicillin-binding protein 2
VAAFARTPYAAAGKTGTAQVISMGKDEVYDADKLHEMHRDHALFMAYAPADQPRVALALIVENAGFGATAAAPIARRVIDYLLLDQWPSEQDIALTQQGRAWAPVGTPRRGRDIVLPGAEVAPSLLARGRAPAQPPASALVATVEGARLTRAGGAAVTGGRFAGAPADANGGTP